MTGVFLFLEVRVLWKDFYYDIVSKRNVSYKLIPKRVAINYSVLTKTGNKIKLNEDIHMNILASLDDI